MDSDETKIDIKKALRVVQTVMDKGTQDGEAYRYDGLYASAGFDGYSAMLYNDYVTLNIFFHNKFTFDYSSRKERDAFMDKLGRIEKAG